MLIKNHKDFYDVYTLPRKTRINELNFQIERLEAVNKQLREDLSHFKSYWFFNWKIKKALNNITFEDLEPIDPNESYDLYINLKAYLLNKILLDTKKLRVKEIKKSLKSYDEYNTILKIFIDKLKIAIIHQSLIFEH